ncbi:MAG: filamentous hemagglutinin N-terminal domain-containing protein, partial [Rhodanobacter sp.]
MNRIYRLVWSRTHGMLIAVAETSSSRSKAGTARQGRPRKVAFAVALALGMVSPLALGHSMVDQIGPDQARKGRDGQLVALVPPPVAGQNMAGPTQSGQSGTNPIGQPLPVGGQVVAGVVRLSQSGDTLTIQQATRSAILNWQSFDISAGYTVDFVQPDAGSVALNRVLGGNPSDIFGQLHANGQVFLVNAAGVYFAPGAEVNVGGLVASTLGISNADFLSGNYHFSGNSGATIRNGGTITSVPRGYVAFIGNHVDNTGKIITPGGTTALGAGAGVDITLANSQLVNFRVSADALNALAANGGLIQADGGRVILSAQARSALLQSVVNNTGVVRTQTVAIHEGVIELLGGNSGTVEVAGTLDASAPAGGNGGQIETSGAHVKVADGTFITTTSST